MTTTDRLYSLKNHRVLLVIEAGNTTLEVRGIVTDIDAHNCEVELNPDRGVEDPQAIYCDTNKIVTITANP